jgi:6,7-dimethyl-8-ribityllumazine synthase
MARDKIYSKENLPDATGLRIAVVTARFNGDITERLVQGATDALNKMAPAEVAFWQVPGCFELPLVVKKLTESGSYDAVIALGAVIRGDTPHFDYVAGEAAAGIARAAYESGVPVAFGVLTTDTAEQARDRAGGKYGNKGADAAMTAVETALVLKTVK